MIYIIFIPNIRIDDENNDTFKLNDVFDWEK